MKQVRGKLILISDCGEYMALYGIGDLHLSFSSNKPMDIFGEKWESHSEKIKENWENVVNDSDTVLIPGDISWAITLQEAMEDLKWLDSLPGKKVLLRGNHDYWWTSVSKMRNLFQEMIFLQNNYFQYESYAICGTRGWDIPSMSEEDSHDMKIYNREVNRLKLSIDSALKDNFTKLIVMMHYPPVYEQFIQTKFTELIESYKVEYVLYGHIHTAFEGILEGVYNGIDYKCISSDYIDFKPVKILD